MFSTDFIFRQQENLVGNQKCQVEFRPLCNKILQMKPINWTVITTQGLSWEFETAGANH